MVELKSIATNTRPCLWIIGEKTCPRRRGHGTRFHPNPQSPFLPSIAKPRRLDYPSIVHSRDNAETSMAVPLLDLNQQHSSLLRELRDVFERTMVSGQFIQGPEVIAFESK